MKIIPSSLSQSIRKNRVKNTAQNRNLNRQTNGQLNWGSYLAVTIRYSRSFYPSPQLPLYFRFFPFPFVGYCSTVPITAPVQNYNPQPRTPSTTVFSKVFPQSHPVSAIAIPHPRHKPVFSRPASIFYLISS